MFLFIPDFHLLSDAGELDYKYSFKKIDSQTAVDRTALMQQLIDAALAFRRDLPDGVKLKPVQTGDFLDLWREQERDDDSTVALVNRIAADNSAVIEGLPRPSK